MAGGSFAFRTLRFFIAVLLLPAVAAAALAIYWIMPSMFVCGFPFVSAELLAVIGGYAAWTLLFAFVPVPTGVYVFGHELTHAAWGLLTGSKIGKITVSGAGGSCVVSNPGMFTTLAPYFVPFYLVVLLLAWLVAAIWIDMRPYALWGLAAVGFTYGFHVTYTVKTLVEVEQPDVREYGRFFSYVLIVLVNLLVLGAGLAFANGVPIGEYGADLANGFSEAYGWTWKTLGLLAVRTAALLRHAG